MPLRHHRTVDRVVWICEAVARSPRGLTLADLAEQLDAPKSSLQELTNGLLATGYLVEDGGRFFIGPGPFVLSLMGSPLAARAIRHEDLERIQAKLKTNVSVAIRVGDSFVHIDQIGANPLLGFIARSRGRRPLLLTAAGKIILANMPTRDLDRFLNDSAREDDPAVRRFLSEMPSILKTKLAYNHAASLDDVYAVATGVVDDQGRFVAAISASGGPDIADKLPEIGKRLRGLVAAMNLS